MKKLLFLALIAIMSFPIYAQETVELSVTKELSEAAKDYDIVEYIGEGVWSIQKKGIRSTYNIVGDEAISVRSPYGLINSKGQVITPCYDNVSTLSEGLLKVKKDGRYGFIDKEGNEKLYQLRIQSLGTKENYWLDSGIFEF
jgi:hypothetical protein